MHASTHITEINKWRGAGCARTGAVAVPAAFRAALDTNCGPPWNRAASRMTSMRATPAGALFTAASSPATSAYATQPPVSMTAVALHSAVAAESLLVAPTPPVHAEVASATPRGIAECARGLVSGDALAAVAVRSSFSDSCPRMAPAHSHHELTSHTTWSDIT